MTTREVVYHHSILRTFNGSVQKQIEPGFQFAEGGQVALMDDMLMFRAMLQHAGVPVAVNYDLRVENGIIQETTDNCGMDGYAIIRCPRAELSAEDVIRKIALALRGTFNADKITVVPDPHPANWCFDESGNIRYIDYQPARFLKDSVHLVGFPQPVGEEYEWSARRYYSKLGIFRMLRFNVMRAGGICLGEVLNKIIRAEYSADLVREIEGGMEKLLVYRVQAGQLSLRDALAKCDAWRVDDIREIALSVTESEDLLNQVLKLTRGDFNLSLEIRHARALEACDLILSIP